MPYTVPARNRTEMLTAWHEAGHAALWLAAGQPVNSLWISGSRGQTRPAARRSKDPLLPAVAALAGPVAEARASGRWVSSLLSDHPGDVAYAADWLDVRRVPQTVINDATREVRRAWRLITAIAEAAAAQRRLGRSDLDRLRRKYT